VWRVTQRESFPAPPSHATLEPAERAWLRSQRTVAVVDPKRCLRQSLCELLQEARFKAAGYDSAESLLETIDVQVPHCIVSEIELPAASGLALQAELARRLIRSPVVFVVSRLEPRRIVEALKGGAFDVLTKPVDPAAFVQCIERAVAQSARLSDAEVRHAAMRARLSELTRRETEVLELAVTGLMNKEIARQLGISHRTVEVHRRQILRKTGASSLLEIASADVRDHKQAGEARAERDAWLEPSLSGHQPADDRTGVDEHSASAQHSSTAEDKPPH
jgi:FixJ family two-component response regulator